MKTLHKNNRGRNSFLPDNTNVADTKLAKRCRQARVDGGFMTIINQEEALGILTMELAELADSIRQASPELVEDALLNIGATAHYAIGSLFADPQDADE